MDQKKKKKMYKERVRIRQSVWKYSGRKISIQSASHGAACRGNCVAFP